MKKKLFIDLDDVTFETSLYVRDKCKEEGIFVEDDCCVYQKVSKNFLKECLSNYFKIPFRKDFLKYFKKLDKIYDIYILSEYYFDEECNAKFERVKEFIDSDKILLVDARKERKFEKDLSDGILIDDNLIILDKVNSEDKICFWCETTSPWDYEGNVIEHNYKPLYSWKEIYEELVKNKKCS